MPKQGILHDYDYHANFEPSSKSQTCIVCGEENMTFQWSDYSGEGMCTKCGCPYQLKWGGKAKEKEGNYPYLNIKESFIPIAKEYWNEKGVFVCYGTMMGPNPGMAGLVSWLENHYPEHLKKA